MKAIHSYGRPVWNFSCRNHFKLMWMFIEISYSTHHFQSVELLQGLAKIGFIDTPKLCIGKGIDTRMYIFSRSQVHQMFQIP